MTIILQLAEIWSTPCNVKGDAFKDINHTLTLGAVPPAVLVC